VYTGLLAEENSLKRLKIGLVKKQCTHFSYSKTKNGFKTLKRDTINYYIFLTHCLKTHHPSAVWCAAGIRSGAAAIYFAQYWPHPTDWWHAMAPHLYADHTQESDSCSPSDLSSISDCLRDIESWMRSNRLQLISSKTEVMWSATPEPTICICTSINGIMVDHVNSTLVSTSTTNSVWGHRFNKLCHSVLTCFGNWYHEPRSRYW